MKGAFTETIARGFCAESDQFIEDHWLNWSDSAQNDLRERTASVALFNSMRKRSFKKSEGSWEMQSLHFNARALL